MTDTVYTIARDHGDDVVYAKSSITDWSGWPDDVRDIVRRWNRDRRLRFVYMGAIMRPTATFECVDCERLIDSSGSTAADFDRVLTCDDCVIQCARKHGVRGRPETELEKAKRWQRNVQKKLDRYRHNALSEAAYVTHLKALLEAHRNEYLDGCREHLGLTDEEAAASLAAFEAEVAA